LKPVILKLYTFSLQISQINALNEVSCFQIIVYRNNFKEQYLASFIAEQNYTFKNIYFKYFKKILLHFMNFTVEKSKLKGTFIA